MGKTGNRNAQKNVHDAQFSVHRDLDASMCFSQEYRLSENIRLLGLDFYEFVYLSRYRTARGPRGVGRHFLTVSGVPGM
jgi:hypothetical protein